MGKKLSSNSLNDLYKVIMLMTLVQCFFSNYIASSIYMNDVESVGDILRE